MKGAETSPCRALRHLAALGATALMVGAPACISFSGITGGQKPDASSDSGATRVDAGQDATGDCGTFSVSAASTLTASFDSPPLPTGWFTPKPCLRPVDGGLLATPETVGTYCSVVTSDYYHLTCSSLTLKVPEVTTQTTGVQIAIYLQGPGTTTAQGTSLILENSGFKFATSSGTAFASFDPSTDIWWRLRESAGTLYLDTSMDGEHWTEKGSTTKFNQLDNVQISIAAGEYQNLPDPGQAMFRCYNLVPTACQ